MGGEPPNVGRVARIDDVEIERGPRAAVRSGCHPADDERTDFTETSGSYYGYVDNTIAAETIADLTVAPPYVWR
jgi:hypothetical protein